MDGFVNLQNAILHLLDLKDHDFRMMAAMAARKINLGILKMRETMQQTVYAIWEAVNNIFKLIDERHMTSEIIDELDSHITRFFNLMTKQVFLMSHLN